MFLSTPRCRGASKQKTHTLPKHFGSSKSKLPQPSLCPGSDSVASMSSASTPQQLVPYAEDSQASQADQRSQESARSTLGDLQAAPAASQHGQARAPGAAQAPMARCKYHCGPPQRLEHLRRSNMKAAWECKACFNAARAIESAAKKDAALKEAIDKMKMDDEEAWHAKVRACRIAPEYGQHGQPGVSSLTERTRLIHKFFTEVMQFNCVKNSGGIKWVTIHGFAKHQAEQYGWDAAKSEVRFKEILVDPTIQKMELPGDEKRVPVMKTPETVVENGRHFAKIVAASARIDSASMASQAMQELADVGHGSASVSSSTFGSAASLFRPGAIVGSASGQAIPFGEFNQPGQYVFGEEAFDNQLLKHALTDAEAACLQTEVPPAKRRRGARGKARQILDGATGPLLAARSDALEQTERISSAYVKACNNAAKRVEQAYKNKPLPDSVAIQVNAYKRLAVDVAAVREQISKWDLLTHADGQATLDRLEASLASSHAMLLTHLKALSEKKKDHRKAALKEAAQEMKTRNRDTKVYKERGVPSNLLRFLYDNNVLLVPSVATAQDGPPGQQRTLMRLSTNASDDHTQEKKAKASSVRNVKVHSADDEIWCTDQPTVFPVGEPGISQVFQSHTKTMGDRVPALIDRVLTSINDSGGLGGCIRVPELGPPDDTLGELMWVPAPHKGFGQKPDHLNTFGAPWVALDAIGVPRYGYNGWPADGLGQLLNCLDGHYVFCVWPVNAVLDRGASLDSAVDLLGDMSQSVFDEWAKTNMRIGHMQSGSAAWIPYGHQSLSIATHHADSARKEVECCSLCVQPYLAASLASACESIQIVTEGLACHVRASLEEAKKGNINLRHWLGVGEIFLKWLEQMGDSRKTRLALEANGNEPVDSASLDRTGSAASEIGSVAGNDQAPAAEEKPAEGANGGSNADRDNAELSGEAQENSVAQNA